MATPIDFPDNPSQGDRFRVDDYEYSYEEGVWKLVLPLGIEGPKGEDGISVTNVQAELTGGQIKFTFSFSDGTTSDLFVDAVKGDKGDRGISIDLVTYVDNGNGTLTITTTLDDGKSFSITTPNLTGPKGDKPAHEWSGTQLRFENPDSSEGMYVDLKGDKGDKGDQGLKGDKPAHTWSGTQLRFENPDGSEGAYVNLQGPKGADGGDITPIIKYRGSVVLAEGGNTGSTVSDPSNPTLTEGVAPPLGDGTLYIVKNVATNSLTGSSEAYIAGDFVIWYQNSWERFAGGTYTKFKDFIADYTQSGTLGSYTVWFADTTSNQVIRNLPASPLTDDEIIIRDDKGTAGTNQIQILANGNKIMGQSSLEITRSWGFVRLKFKDVDDQGNQVNDWRIMGGA